MNNIPTKLHIKPTAISLKNLLQFLNENMFFIDENEICVHKIKNVEITYINSSNLKKSIFSYYIKFEYDSKIFKIEICNIVVRVNIENQHFFKIFTNESIIDLNRFLILSEFDL